MCLIPTDALLESIDWSELGPGKSCATLVPSTTLTGEPMPSAECPECGGTITFKSSPELQQLVNCPDCGGELDVVSLNTATLDLAPTEEEDWGE
jgi:alpha-aminoadipate/glutamate carrier protein LysW